MWALRRSQSDLYLCDSRHGCTGSNESIGGVAQLFDLLLSKAVLPKLWVVFVVFSLPHRLASNLSREGLIRLDLIIIWRGLTAGLDTIGKDMW